MTGTIAALAMAMALFVSSHIALAAPVIRKPLVAAVGAWPFRLAYSVVALGLIFWVVAAYNAAPFVEVWWPPTAARHMSLSLMPFATTLVVCGLATPNPTMIWSEGRAVLGAGPVGIIKVTRHPMMWGITIWGVSHLLARGDAASMILFGGMTVLALAGAAALDAKKQATLGDAWDAFAAKTSFWPMAAVFAGRTRVTLGEIGWWRIALGLALYAALLAIHPWLFGVSPFLA